MTTTVREHYDGHLARHYTWLFGGMEENLERNRRFFADHAITPGATGHALDLGCGSGFQAIPLAEAGFRVTAVDISRELLRELAEHAGPAVVPVQADLLDVLRQGTAPCDVCVCMGDTLAHLDSLDDVAALIDGVRRVLVPGGRCVLTFRDYGEALAGAARFLPVRGDDDRTVTCALDYTDDAVIVHDIIWSRGSDGWRMAVSSYRKLRLTASRVVAMLEEAGFHLLHTGRERGMSALIAAV